MDQIDKLFNYSILMTELYFVKIIVSMFTEKCVEFQKLNMSNGSMFSFANATSPVMEFWE